ncbi:MAG: response regulator [Candidatus Eisenbacteria bacterium]|jgi:CheY-like chemotaxis protein|nr:response regulator [Candidatus Eisenbacteria bacterium]
MTRVVVVEDDPHNAVLFRKLLEKRLGFSVLVTESPEELFEAARSGDVALVVMDVSLAHSTLDGEAVNGVALCRMLKGERDTASIPVLLATAHAMRGDAERLLAESGADDYISKPIVDHSQFVEQVRALVQEAA